MDTGYRNIMKNRGFLALLGAQFLGALNDNLLKMTAVLLLTAHAAGSPDRIAASIAIAGAMFVLPYLFFSGLGGQLADRIRKDRAIFWVKAGEAPIMILAVGAFWLGNDWAIYVLLFLIAVQFTLFSPAKYGILPEILPPEHLSKGNALIETSTYLAIILGAVLGGILYDVMTPASIAWLMTGIAFLGLKISFFVTEAKEPRASAQFSLRPSANLIPGFKEIMADRKMLMTVIGIGWFWLLGALLQMLAIEIGRDNLGLGGSSTGALQAAIAVGIGAGSLLAGRLSGPKVEPGLVPLGSLGLGFASLWLSVSTGAFWAAVPALAALGFAGGIFIVPLNAVLQQKAQHETRGRIIACANVAGTIGILAASGISFVFGGQLGWSPAGIISLVGLATFLGTAVALLAVPDFLTRFVIWALTHTLYRIRIVNAENVPLNGPALIVSNHMSFVDGFLIGACIQRFVRFMVYSGFFKGPTGWFLRKMRCIPISGRDSMSAIKRARAELEAGHVVCIFAEGAITRTGTTMPFKRGLEIITKDLDVPVIPVHLDQVWGSIFSFKGGKFFWKRPDRLRRPVTVSFGTPMKAPKAWEVKRAVMELGSHAWDHRQTSEDLIHVRALQTAKRRWKDRAMHDTTGMKLTFGEAAIGAALLARRFKGEKTMVGVLLPASVGATLVNYGLMLAGKTPVNINFTAGMQAIDAAVSKCKLTRIITSRKFLEKAKLEAPAGALYVEDLLSGISKREKVITAILVRVLPSSAVSRFLGGNSGAPATVMFSSGSSGQPKGIVLSHKAIVANLEAISQTLWIDRSDAMAAVLPPFHSFGFTATICLPLVAGITVGYNANPLDAKAIGPLVKRTQATILLGTPTFLQSWMRSADPLEMITLRHVIAGAERLRPELADAFEEKYGVRPLEGYGMTEMGPVVSVNALDVQDGTQEQIGRKDGTVGRPVPGVAVRIVHPETGEILADGTEGHLLLKSPAMMDGYLGDPVRTGEVIDDGWYKTGDIALIDDDGFLKITDRLSRFSKIAGEMVPHGRIESELVKFPGVDAGCVVALPDAARGEKIVALYAGAAEPEEVLAAFNATNLPKLWLPKKDAVRKIGEVPLLGSGKLDLARAKEIAKAV